MEQNNSLIINFTKQELKDIMEIGDTIEKEKEADAKLNGAKELIKEMSAPYKDSIKVQKAKAKYALFLLEQKGEDLDNQE